MLKKNVMVGNIYGITMSPAFKIALTCRGTSSKVTLKNGLVNASGVSILEILQLKADFGNKLEIVTEGVDEETAMEKVAGLF
jgi:phosphotransferase system HPr (HPr) family protein